MKHPPRKPIFETMSDTASELVVVHTASSFPEAQLVAGLLESEGIRAVVPGAELSDEFGSAMKMGASDVVVRRVDLPKATDIVAAWNAKGDDS